MRLVKKYIIKRDGDLIFAKRDLKNFINNKLDTFQFALMELGTNILKYPKKGEIWIIEEKGRFGLAALDRGCGIKDINWALKKGTTTFKNGDSLGLGLYQLSQGLDLKFNIFSSKDGTVVLVDDFIREELIYFSLPMIESSIYNGDFFAKKKKFFIFGDSAGHGKKAALVAKKIKEIFFSTTISCFFVEDFFKIVDAKLKKENLRGAVFCLIEKIDRYILLCGVGDIGFLHNNHYYTFNKGVVGEYYSSVKKFEFRGDIVVFTDGVDEIFLKKYRKDVKDNYLMVLIGVYFSKRGDDRSILIIGG